MWMNKILRHCLPWLSSLWVLTFSLRPCVTVWIALWVNNIMSLWCKHRRHNLFCFTTIHLSSTLRAFKLTTVLDFVLFDFCRGYNLVCFDKIPPNEYVQKLIFWILKGTLPGSLRLIFYKPSRKTLLQLEPFHFSDGLPNLTSGCRVINWPAFSRSIDCSNDPLNYTTALSSKYL